MVGGICAFIGAKILGPRIGKYDKNGNSKAIPGHSIPLGALGCFILWFCWFGFNGASTVSMVNGGNELAGKVFFNTNLSAAMATVTVLIITWVLYKKPDVSMTLNGSLAGLVAVTAGCDVVEPWAAAVIGIIAGFALVAAVEFIDKKLKIDDPVGACGVHMVCGSLGTILTGVFCSAASLEKMGMTRGELLGAQFIGVIATAVWTAVAITITFTLIKKTIGLRVTPEEEIQGLDLPEHGLVSAYADFMPAIPQVDSFERSETTGAVPVDEAVPVQLRTAPAGVSAASDTKITKIELIIKQEKFEALKDALMGIGITGMTVTHVLG